MVEVLIRLQGTILIYMFMGFLLKKSKMIDEKASQFLSSFILEFILPINIFYSCITSFTYEVLKSCVVILLIAIIIELTIYFVTGLNFIKIPKEQIMVIRYGLLVSNGGLIGTPVIEGLYGASGVMYANIFLVPQRMLAYVAGEGIFNPNKKKKTVREMVVGVVSNKVVLALVLGILIAILPFTVPTFISNALQGISKCLSPLSLILVGSILAEQFESTKSENIEIGVVAILRQIVIPLIVLFCLKFVEIEPLIKSIIVLLVGMPIASTTAIFAHKYHNGDGFASKAVFVSTLSSTITLVILMGIIEIVLFA